MAKIPDFSKFDLQGIVNSIKTIINPESVPHVDEGDPIGAKMVQISTLIQNVVTVQGQLTKDISKINRLLNDLYKDLESFRQTEADLSKEPPVSGKTTGSSTAERSNPDLDPYRKSEADFRKEPPADSAKAAGSSSAENIPKTPYAQSSSTESSPDIEPSVGNIDLKKEEEKLKNKNQSPLSPNEGTSAPTDKD